MKADDWLGCVPQAAAEFLRALAHPTRLQILCRLLDGEAAVAAFESELGLKQPLLGGDGWESPELYKIGGAALEGCYFSNHCAPDSTESAVRNFVSKYSARWGHTPGALAMLGYDAVKVLADAIKRAPDLAGASLRDALTKTKNYPGVTGQISMDANRDAVKSAVILKIKDGKATYLATVKP